jgi:hypothetical protein
MGMRTITNNVSNVLTVFKQLPVKDKIAVSKAIDREILLIRASKLDKSVVENNISMNDIITETKAVRREKKQVCS